MEVDNNGDLEVAVVVFLRVGRRARASLARVVVDRLRDESGTRSGYKDVGNFQKDSRRKRKGEVTVVRALVGVGT